MIERDVESMVEEELERLGWNTNIHDINRQVYKQNPRTQTEIDLLKDKTKYPKHPDFILYATPQDLYPIAVIETKSSTNTNFEKAKIQVFAYMHRLHAPFCFIYNGNTVLAYNDKQELLQQNNEPINRLLSLHDLQEFKNNPNNIKTAITSKQQLLDLFSKVNDKLRESGITVGFNRFNEFATLIFLKIASDNNYLYELDPIYLFAHYLTLDGTVLLSFLNNNVIPYVNTKFKLNDTDLTTPLFAALQIKDPIKLKEIIQLLNTFDFNRLDLDVKGLAFEYFMQQYNTANNDLGEYFTPRHYVRFLNQLMDLKFGETVYDPFAGTGGMLLVAYQTILNQLKAQNLISPANLQLLNHAFYGSEISNTSKIAKLNLILSGCLNAQIYKQNTFLHPQTNKYDKIISNIPFNMHINSNESNLYEPQVKTGNSLALLHIVQALNTNSKNAMAAVIVPESFLTNSADQIMRKYLLEHHLLTGIISLPSKAFLPYTATKTSILLIQPQTYKDVFFYQVLDDGYTLTDRRIKKEGINDLDRFLEIYKDPAKLKTLKHIKQETMLAHPNTSFLSFHYPNETKAGYVLLSDILQEETNKNTINADTASVISDLTYGWMYGKDYWKENFVSVTTQKDNKNYKLVQPGMIVYSPARINVGSIAYNHSKKAFATSTAYKVVSLKPECKANWNMEYLYFVLKTNKAIKQQIKTSLQGAGRSEFKLTSFLALEVKVISKKEQDEIVAKIKAKINNYETSKQEIEKMELEN